MRYLFRGLIRDTGRAVEGHVEGATQDEALDALSTNGIVTESLAPDPKPLNMNDELPTAPEFADALESAFDSSSSQVDFDALTQRYTGKKVWVIDRDKIKRRVGQVVDAALALSAQHGEGPGMARERVANAITGLFSDNRNIASERNADSMAGVRFNESANQPAPPPPPAMPAMRQVNGNGNGAGYAAVPAGGHPGLENQVARIANLVKQAEAALAAVSAAARRASLGGGGGGGGGGGRRFSPSRRGGGEEQNGVLLEIFKSNLALVRGMQSAAEAELAPPATEAPTSDQPPEPPAMESVSGDAFPPPPQPPELVGAGNES